MSTSREQSRSIPVIDLFAGPGGLGEGFSKSNAPFALTVSIEKDEMAYETLRLRAAFRALEGGSAGRSTWNRWHDIVASTPWNVVFQKLKESSDPAIEAACGIAEREAWNLELGAANRDIVSKGIRQRLRPYMRGGNLPQNAVLIGGPPCQAYSVVGRSRNRGTDGYRAVEDHRHFLYREYLRVIAEFRPALFVMENVKGILSAKVEGADIFHTITKDLRRPDLACNEDRSLGYVLTTLTACPSTSEEPTAADFVVLAENHGVPQARHRVIVCGVRRDVWDRIGALKTLRRQASPTVGEAIGDLPMLRPGVSFRGRGKHWLACLKSELMRMTLKELRASRDTTRRKIAAAMVAARKKAQATADPGSGSDRFEPHHGAPVVHQGWYQDRKLPFVANHESRSHMPEDLVRYLFVAAYGAVTGASPRLSDFPACILPRHNNIDPTAPASAIFKDRFRVQCRARHSTTVTSHIAKDGHAFIHPDPVQCRSLTVREAARLQTFPDSYVFLGNRTSQYTQVGNAVPPYLARQIAEIVGDALERAGMSS